MAPKKQIKRTPRAPKPAPVATAMPTAACSCGCGCHSTWFKKFIILLLVFAAGFATCHFMCMKPGFYGFHHAKRMPQEMFVNGCLDTAKIQNERMLQKIAIADKDADGCITMEEMDAHRAEMRGNPEMRGKPDMGPKQDMGGKPEMAGKPMMRK